MKHLLPIAAIVTSLAALFRPAPEVMDPDLREFARRLTMYDAPIDTFGHTARTARLEGINLQLVDGSGYTAFHPGNGTGNLILGYNDTGLDPVDRSGSHNFVIGNAHNWSVNACAGIVAGDGNYLMADSSAVLGGTGNETFGWLSVVVGGTSNYAAGERSVAGGGFNRNAYSADDWVAGSLWEDQ